MNDDFVASMRGMASRSRSMISESRKALDDNSYKPKMAPPPTISTMSVEELEQLRAAWIDDKHALSPIRSLILRLIETALQGPSQ